MKKPCKGERTGLNPELRKINILLAALLISGEVFSQVPINGFCKYNSYKTAQNFSSIFSMNFNGDSYTDLLLYNSANKDYQLLTGGPNGFSVGSKLVLPEEISKINYIFNKENLADGFAFTSRRQLKAGIYNFSSTGKAEISTSFKFNSYPENISVADINTDGIAEYLISGSAFDGLSILYKEGEALKERKINSGAGYTDALLTDLNNDGIPDIAAFNLISNSLIFFYNYGDGYFNQVRSIQMKERIYNLYSADINLDMYQDIIYLHQGKINILYGDFQSSYEEKNIIKTAYVPNSFITGDFNRDGRIDIIYLNLAESIVSILYSKNEKDFYPEIILFKKKEIKEIIPYYSKFIAGIAAIGSAGEVFTISNISSIGGGVNLFAGADPVSIVNFDNENNGITDIAYIEKFTKSLKLILRNNAGIPSIFYSIGLVDEHSEIEVDNLLSNEKYFACYTKNKNLIELIGINFKKNIITKKTVYVPGKILDVKINRKTSDGFEIIAGYNNMGKLGINIYDQNDARSITRNFENISSNILDAKIISFGRPALLYWKNRNDSLVFFKTENFSNSEQIFSTDLYNKEKKIYFQSFSEDFLNNDEPAALTFIGDNQNKSVVLSQKTGNNIFLNNLPVKNISLKNKLEFFFGELKINGIKKLLIYNPEQGRLYRVDFLNKGNKINFDPLFDELHAESFFVKNMNSRNYHLVYINKKENCISIKQMP